MYHITKEISPIFPLFHFPSLSFVKSVPAPLSPCYLRILSKPTAFDVAVLGLIVWHDVLQLDEPITANHRRAPEWTGWKSKITSLIHSILVQNGGNYLHKFRHKSIWAAMKISTWTVYKNMWSWLTITCKCHPDVPGIFFFLRGIRSTVVERWTAGQQAEWSILHQGHLS